MAILSTWRHWDIWRSRSICLEWHGQPLKRTMVRTLWLVIQWWRVIDMHQHDKYQEWTLNSSTIIIDHDHVCHFSLPIAAFAYALLSLLYHAWKNWLKTSSSNDILEQGLLGRWKARMLSCLLVVVHVDSMSSEELEAPVLLESSWWQGHLYCCHRQIHLLPKSLHHYPPFDHRLQSYCCLHHQTREYNITIIDAYPHLGKIFYISHYYQVSNHKHVCLLCSKTPLWYWPRIYFWSLTMNPYWCFKILKSLLIFCPLKNLLTIAHQSDFCSRLKFYQSQHNQQELARDASALRASLYNTSISIV